MVARQLGRPVYRRSRTSYRPFNLSTGKPGCRRAHIDFMGWEIRNEMSTLSLRLPDSLHRQVKVLARQDGISIHQFISSAVAEKVAVLVAEECLKERTQAGSKSDIFKALSKVPATDPVDNDILYGCNQCKLQSDAVWRIRKMNYSCRYSMVVKMLRRISELAELLMGRV